MLCHRVCRSALLLMLACLVSALPLHAATPERAIMVREASLYLSPDETSQKMGIAERGREVAIIEKSNRWVHVLANLGVRHPEDEEDRQVTAWIVDKGVIRTSTPNGDSILFGEAVDSEAEASKRRGRKGAAQDALRLYARMAEYFPKSPLAGEALYRAADIRWQVEREDARSRPSFKAADPSMRTQANEDYLRDVEKKFPHTKWADLAAFDRLDNKVCGDWQGNSKCPEKEAEIYEKYAAERPESPKLAEALYEAAWRRSALIEIYKTEAQPAKSAESRTKALALLQRILTQPQPSDWTARAQDLSYKIEQNIPTFGNVVE